MIFFGTFYKSKEKTKSVSVQKIPYSGKKLLQILTELFFNKNVFGSFNKLIVILIHNYIFLLLFFIKRQKKTLKTFCSKTWCTKKPFGN